MCKQLCVHASTAAALSSVEERRLHYVVCCVKPVPKFLRAHSVTAMLDNGLVMLAQAEATPLPRAVSSANYNQTLRAACISLHTGSRIWCSMSLTCASWLRYCLSGASSSSSSAGGVDSGVVDLLIAGGPPTSSGAFCVVFNGTGFFRRAPHTVRHWRDGGAR